MRRFLAFFLLAASALAQQQVQPVAGVLTLNLVPGTSSFKVILSANVTSVVIQNPTPGTIISVIFTENATGGFTVTFGGNISSSSCNINTAASATTTCQFQYDSTSNTWNGIGTVGTLPNSPLPAATSGPGPVFNVKNYGSKGDTQSSANCTTSTLNLNCTDVTFTAANVNQRVSCNANGGGALFGGTPTTFAAFVDAHDMTLATSGGSFSATCLWGTPDDTVMTTVLAAALAQVCSKVTSGNLCTSTAAPTIYFPSGAYNLYTASFNVTGSSNVGFAIKGDGAGLTKIYWHEGATNAQGAGIQIAGSIQDVTISGLTLDGAFQAQSFSNAALLTTGNVRIQDVTIQRFASDGIQVQGGVLANRLNTVSNAGNGMRCAGCNGEVYESLFSNNTLAGMIISNVTGLTGGNGLRLINNLFDENGSNNACDIIVQTSHDVWLQGVPVFGSTNGASGQCGMSVDGNSLVHWSGGLTGPFGSEFPKTGVRIATGGVLQSSDVRYVAAGTGNCIVNSGVFNDNGGNSCETVYAISSGTSTGTTAVLTLASNTVNVNTNCAVGDALIVEGAGIAGYNGYYPAGATSGITAVTATTLTYTTAGSNLGALSGGGNAYCRNLITYSGTLPRALLNNPIPNTCYLTITPITNATTFNLCNWGAGQATNITRITASSQVVTTCATAPIVTISNGTVSETLTLTSGKQFWDSFNAQDLSTGVGTTIFKPSISATGTDRITIKYDVAAASACATPPTNLGVTYTIAPILSN